MTSTVTTTAAVLTELAIEILGSAGVPEADARATADILVLADLQGITTHGTQRLGPYVERIRRDSVNPRPNVVVEEKTASLALVNGDDGLGQVAATRAVEVGLRLVEDTGIAYVGCLNSNHFGAIAPYAWRVCRNEIACVIGTNASTSIAPWGGADVKLGNNPFAIGAPRRDAAPFVLDIAMSFGARGKMRRLQERGEPLPPGWALDAEGNPTTDPAAGLAGFIQPIGGHKGAGLSMAIDILSGVLTGSGFATGVASMWDANAGPQRVGHFFVLIDPAKLIGLDTYYERMEAYAETIKSTPPVRAGGEVLLPGEPEAREHAKRSTSGIPMDEQHYATLRALANG